MRTPSEIKHRMKQLQCNIAFMGTIQDLVDCLPFEEAKDVYSDDYIKQVESGEVEHEQVTTDEQVIALMKDYLPFAYDKAEGQRGLSAMRSIAHYSNWLWLIGDDELAKAILIYDDYGIPQLDLINNRYNLSGGIK